MYSISFCAPPPKKNIRKECLLFYVTMRLLTQIETSSRAAVFRPILSAYGLWAGRRLYPRHLLWHRASVLTVSFKWLTRFSHILRLAMCTEDLFFTKFLDRTKRSWWYEHTDDKIISGTWRLNYSFCKNWRKHM